MMDYGNERLNVLYGNQILTVKAYDEAVAALRPLSADEEVIYLEQRWAISAMEYINRQGSSQPPVVPVYANYGI